MVKNKEQNPYRLRTITALFLIIVLLANSLITYLGDKNLQSQINDLPKRVCHNETEDLTMSYGNYASTVIKLINGSIDDYEIICDKECIKPSNLTTTIIILHQNGSRENIIGNLPDWFCSNKCLIKSTKEVCEIV